MPPKHRGPGGRFVANKSKAARVMDPALLDKNGRLLVQTLHVMLEAQPEWIEKMRTMKQNRKKKMLPFREYPTIESLLLERLQDYHCAPDRTLVLDQIMRRVRQITQEQEYADLAALSESSLLGDIRFFFNHLVALFRRSVKESSPKRLQEWMREGQRRCQAIKEDTRVAKEKAPAAQKMAKEAAESDKGAPQLLTTTPTVSSKRRNKPTPKLQAMKEAMQGGMGEENELEEEHEETPSPKRAKSSMGRVASPTLSNRSSPGNKGFNGNESLQSLYALVNSRLSNGQYAFGLALCREKLQAAYGAAEQLLSPMSVDVSAIRWLREQIAALWCSYANVLLQIGERKGSPAWWKEQAKTALCSAASCPLVGNHCSILLSLVRLLTVRSANDKANSLKLSMELCQDGIERAHARLNKRLEVSGWMTGQAGSGGTTKSPQQDGLHLDVVLGLPSQLVVENTPYIFVDKRSAAAFCVELNRLSRLQEEMTKESLIVSGTALSINLAGMTPFPGRPAERDLRTVSIDESKHTPSPLYGKTPHCKEIVNL